MAKAIPANDKSLRPKNIDSKWQALTVSAILIILAFFLLSGNLFGTYGLVTATPIGVGQSVGSGKTVAVNDWKYCAAEHTMQVELRFTNTLYDGNDDYSFTSAARTLSVTRLPVKVVLADGDLYVVQIPNVPSSASAFLLDITNDVTNATTRLFATKESVTNVDDLPEQTPNEYRIESLKGQIAEYEMSIAELNSNSEARREKVRNITLEIAGIEAEKAYMTAAEKAEADTSIHTLQTTINGEEKSIADNEALIQEYTARIALLNKQIDDINNG